MITNTQMPQYVDCENDCQSRPWVFPDRDFLAYYACIYYKNLNSTLWNIDMTEKNILSAIYLIALSLWFMKSWESQPENGISNL